MSEVYGGKCVRHNVPLVSESVPECPGKMQQVCPACKREKNEHIRQLLGGLLKETRHE